MFTFLNRSQERTRRRVWNQSPEELWGLRLWRSLTSRAGLGARRPVLQSPLIGLLLDHVVVVDWNRVFVDDVLVH